MAGARALYIETCKSDIGLADVECIEYSPHHGVHMQVVQICLEFFSPDGEAFRGDSGAPRSHVAGRVDRSADTARADRSTVRLLTLEGGARQHDGMTAEPAHVRVK